MTTLTPTSFDLGDAPTATVSASYTKNKKLAVQPLSADVAESLKPYLAGRPA